MSPKISLTSGDINSILVASTSMKLDAHKYFRMRDLDDINVASRSKFEIFLPSTNLKSKFSYVQADINKPELNTKGRLISLDTFDGYFFVEHELTDKVTLETLLELEKIHLVKKYPNLYDGNIISFEAKLSNAFSDKLRLGPLLKSSYTKIKKPKRFLSHTIAVNSKYEASHRLNMGGYMGLQLYNNHESLCKNSFTFKYNIEYMLSFPSKIVAEVKQKMVTTMDGSVFQKTILNSKLFLLVYRMLALGISASTQYHNYKNYGRHDRLTNFGINFRAYFGKNKYIDILSYQFAHNHSDMVGKSYVAHTISSNIYYEF
ncbi:MAG: hypothetical protein LBI37_02235 [Puniceicoccales bacterium]|nr:hypothetical protein [Puniceicoccales bacterium]